jgi:hypothetical protein
MADLGLEGPESLGATFLADASTLAEWTRGTPALDDDHPGRILARYPAEGTGDPMYRSWMEPRLVRQRFESSAFIRDLWPPALRRRSRDSFAPQAVFDDLCVWRRFNSIEALHGVLTLSSLRTLPLLLMGTEPAVQRIAVALYDAGTRNPGLEFELGARAMSERDYEGAARHLALATDPSLGVRARLLRTLALQLLGRGAEARRCLDSLEPSGLSAMDTNSAGWLDELLRGKFAPR